MTYSVVARDFAHIGTWGSVSISSVDEWVNAHRYHFYLEALEDVADSRLEAAGKKAPARTEDAIRETMTAKDAPHVIRYRFDTAYAAPERFVKQLAGRYPQLYFRLTWEGECSEVHGMAVHPPIKHEWRGQSGAAVPPGALLTLLTPMAHTTDQGSERPRREHEPAA